MTHLQLISWVNLIVVAAFPTSASGIVVDGSLVGDESSYGAALSIQNTNTQYGNATNNDPRFANGGSEIDQIFGAVRGDRLYMLVGGNLESNFNKLEVFIDSTSGGMNQLNGSNLPPRVDPYCCPGVSPPTGALQQLNGLRFDAGFEADHYLAFSNGVHSIGSPLISRWTLTAYFADLAHGATGKKSEVGFQYNPYGVEPGLLPGEPIDQLNNGCTGPADTSCSPPEHEFAEPPDSINDPTNARGHRNLLNDIGLMMAIDNSNTAGVVSGTGATSNTPHSVITGIEFSLPLSVLGNPTGDIRATVFIANGSHSHVSNQFSGVGVLRPNLGSNIAGINLAAIAENQFVTVPGHELAGDYNRNGIVDAADYTVWRNYLVSGAALPNDETPGVDVDDYTRWKENFGETVGARSFAFDGTTVPEPSAQVLLIVGLAGWRFRPQKTQTIEVRSHD